VPTRRVAPEEALDLMRERDYVYLDVRSVPEYDEGHPSGAYNVPIVHMGPGGGQPNDDFLAVVERLFPKDKGIVVGCRTAARSEHAAALMERAGFSNVVLQRAGFAGVRDGLGRLDPGWTQKSLPTTSGPEAGRSWADLEGAPK
jgi:rhodanese-related sulfurtransferase